MQHSFFILFFLFFINSSIFAMFGEEEAQTQKSLLAYPVKKIKDFLIAAVDHVTPTLRETSFAPHPLREQIIKQYLRANNCFTNQCVASWKELFAWDDPWAQGLLSAMTDQAIQKRLTDLFVDCFMFLEAKGTPLRDPRWVSRHRIEQELAEYLVSREDYFLSLSKCSVFFQWVLDAPSVLYPEWEKFKICAKKLPASYKSQPKPLWEQSVRFEYALNATLYKLFGSQENGGEMGENNLAEALEQLLPFTQKRLCVAEDDTVTKLKEAYESIVKHRGAPLAEVATQVSAYLLAYGAAKTFHMAYIQVNPCHAHLQKTLDVIAALEDIVAAHLCQKPISLGLQTLE